MQISSADFLMKSVSFFVLSFIFSPQSNDRFGRNNYTEQCLSAVSQHTVLTDCWRFTRLTWFSVLTKTLNKFTLSIIRSRCPKRVILQRWTVSSRKDQYLYGNTFYSHCIFCCCQLSVPQVALNLVQCTHTHTHTHTRRLPWPLPCTADQCSHTLKTDISPFAYAAVCVCVCVCVCVQTDCTTDWQNKHSAHKQWPNDWNVQKWPHGTERYSTALKHTHTDLWSVYFQTISLLSWLLCPFSTFVYFTELALHSYRLRNCKTVHVLLQNSLNKFGVRSCFLLFL